MGLLYWGPILEALSFYEKIFWALFKKKRKKVGLIKFFLGPYFRGLQFLWKKILGLIFFKKVGLIKCFLGPYFRGLKFLWKKILGLILKKLGLKLKKIGFIKFFWGLIIKYFGPYLLGALGNGLTTTKNKLFTNAHLLTCQIC
jgi:hypothetical protein